MKVVISSRAENDILAIADYIALDNPTRARSFARELIAKARGVGRAPLSHQVLPGFEGEGLRRRLHKEYAIVFRIEAGFVSVLRIIHGSRDYAKILGSDD